MSKGRPNKDQRLKRLLECGFFPNELPPPFVSDDLARSRRHLSKHWPAGPLDKFVSSPESFPVPRHGRARRRLSLINPINHFKVSKLIADEWMTIRQFLSTSKISEFKPVFDMEGYRTFHDIDFDRIERRTTEILAQNSTCIKTDISRYYHTIYTHSIPWALYTKQYCKDNRFSASFKLTLGDRLDRAIRQCQSDQTMGIPVGPDTSRVIGEIIGVAIERQLTSQLLHFDQRALRFVDDMYIGIETHENPSTIISAASRALSYFELDINIEKTAVLGVEENTEPDWISELRRFNISKFSGQQQTRIEEFFKKAIYLSGLHPKDGVLRYAIKKSRSFLLKDGIYEYYFDWIMRICRHDSSCIPAMAQIFIENNYLKKNVNIEKLKRFIVGIIDNNINSHYAFEISWALFISKALKIPLSSDALNKILQMDSSICSLIVLDLNDSGLVDGPIDLSLIEKSNVKENLDGPLWLLIYEASLKGWIAKKTPCFIQNHPLFGELIKKKVSFYNTKRNVKTTKKELFDARKRERVAKFIFAHLDDYF